MEYYNRSSSGVVSAALQRWAERLTPNTLIHFLLPHFSGSPTEGFEDTATLLGLGALPNFNERTGYVGVLPLLFALFAVVCRRCKFTIFYLSLALISLLVIYGVPPLPAILCELPVLCSITQTRLLLFTSFSVAVMAGLGWDTFSRMKKRRKAMWVVLGFWCAVARRCCGSGVSSDQTSMHWIPLTGLFLQSSVSSCPAASWHPALQRCGVRVGDGGCR